MLSSHRRLSLHLRYDFVKLLTTGGVLPQPSFFQHDETIGSIKILLIVADNEKSFSFPFQFRKYLVVKLLPEQRVLVSSPLVKDVDWLVFQTGGDERETFALPLRKICGGKDAIFNLNFVRQPELLKVTSGKSVQFCRRWHCDRITEAKIRKHSRKLRPVFFTIEIVYWHAVVSQLPGFGNI